MKKLPKIISIVLLSAAILIVASYGWLRIGKKDINFLKPYLETSVRNIITGSDVTISDLELRWKRFFIPVIHIENAVLNGKINFSMKNVDVTLSAWQLFRNRYRIFSADISNCTIRFMSGTLNEENTKNPFPIYKILRKIDDLNIILKIKSLGLEYEYTALQVENIHARRIFNGPYKLTGDFLTSQDKRSNFYINLVRKKTPKVFILDGFLSKFSVQDAYAYIKGVKLPDIKGEILLNVLAEVDQNNIVNLSRSSAAIKDVEVFAPGIKKDPYFIDQIDLKGVEIKRKQIISVEDVKIRNKDLNLHGSVYATETPDKIDFMAKLWVSAFDKKVFSKYAPFEFAPVTCDWIESHIHSGKMQNGSVFVEFCLPKKEEIKPEFDFQVTMPFNNFKFEYVLGYPAITDASGLLKVNTKRLSIDFSYGKMLNSHLKNCKLILSDFRDEIKYFDISGTAQGPTEDVMVFARAITDNSSEFLNKTRLEGGNAESELSLHFPLKRIEQFTELNVNYNGLAKNSYSNIFGLDSVFTDQTRIRIQTDKIYVKASVLYKHLNSRCNWRTNLNNGHSSFDATLYWNEQSSRNLKLPLFFRGQQELTGKYNFLEDQLIISVNSNATDIMITDKKRNVLKNRNEISTIKGSVKLFDNGFSLEGFKYRSGRASIHLNAKHNGLENSATLQLKNVEKCTGILRFTGNKDFNKIVYDGSSLNLALLANMNYAASEDTGMKNLNLKVHADELFYKDEKLLSKVDFDFKSGNRKIIDASIDANINETDKFTIKKSADSSVYEMEFDNLGKFLKDLEIYDNIKSGKVYVSIQPDGIKRALKGKVEVKDFVILDAPASARFISMGSLKGFTEGFKTGGVPFEKLTLNYDWKDKKIDFSNVQLVNPGLYVTANGFLNDKEINLVGEISLFQKLSDFMNKVPIIKMLTDGNGVSIASYSIFGKWGEVDSSMKFLSKEPLRKNKEYLKKNQDNKVK